MADPGSQPLLLQAAERAEAGDFAQAAELSQQLLSRDEADVDALFLLGRSLAMLDRNDEAIEALEKAAKAQPDNIEVFNLLGHLLYHSSRHEESKNAFSRCLELNPDSQSAPTMGAIGDVYLMTETNWDRYSSSYGNSCLLYTSDAADEL